MSLWGELKRRDVFKVAVAYLVAAWLIVQVVSVLIGPLNLPDNLDTVVVVLLAIGFPFALVIAWIYEVTPDGIRVTSDGGGSRASAPSERLTYVVVVLFVLAVGLMAIDRFAVDSSANGFGTGSRLAILPCADLSPDPSNAFFAPGMHGELIRRLGSLGGLDVISQPSVQQYADGHTPLPEIAEALRAQAIMQCSVQYSGDRVLMTAFLFDGESDTFLWSDAYQAVLTEDLSEIYENQADIAMNVANALRVEFFEDERERIERVLTESEAAYVLYLRARTTGDFDEAIRLLDQAIALDPAFAAAYAQKGARLAVRIINAGASDTIAQNRADREQLAAAAEMNIAQALSLDPDLGEAWNARAMLDGFYWRVQEATEAFARALELAPSDASIVTNSALWAIALGEYDRALDLARRRVRLEPNLAGSYHTLGYAQLARRDSAAAVEAYRRAARINPSALNINVFLGFAEAQAGNAELAFRQFQLVEDIADDGELLLFAPHLIEGYSVIGQAEDAERLFKIFEQATDELDIGLAHRARASLAIGDHDRAYELLQSAVERIEAHEAEEGYFSLIEIKANYFDRDVLDEPEFRALLDRIGSLSQ